MERNRRFTNDEMLNLLKNLLNKHGKISGFLIDETDGMPTTSGYRSRFGSLIRAYQLIGYTPERDYQYIEINRMLRKMNSQVIATVISKIIDMGGKVDLDGRTDLLTINNEFTTSIVIARCRFTKAGSLRWLIRLDTGLDEGIQRALRQAYESKKLRGKKLFIARRLIEQRKSKGKALRRGISHKRKAFLLTLSFVHISRRLEG